MNHKIGDVMTKINEVILSESEVVDSVELVELLECGQQLDMNEAAQFEQCILELDAIDKAYQPVFMA